MPLGNQVTVSRRFQRAIRVDTDLRDPGALEGFLCPRSSSVVLETMAHHVAETEQGAFTWTGPYGSGKSSLVIALASLLGGDASLRRQAADTIGSDTAELVCKSFPPKYNGWRVLPIVGRRERPEQLVGEAINGSGLAKGRKRKSWSEKQALDALAELAFRDEDASGGLVVFVDEMGKVLEGVARDGSDVYFFQQLAEMASRSKGRLLVVGILHQAFEEYSYRLSREMRDEWAKIQGRFVDLPVNTGADEQLALLGRAIEKGRRPAEPGLLAASVARLVNRPASEDLADLLEDCWPLHPVVASLLGPISRRRFGQNQRSIFGFLNSGEPGGFQDFLKRAQEGDLYTPAWLWDYLQLNLEPSIMASPDGHRWAMAVEALERCQSLGGEDLHLGLLQAIALVDLFKERSGLTASVELLETLFWEAGSSRIMEALVQLERWSLLIYRKFNGSYSIFEGTDFNVDEAVGRAIEPMENVDFGRLNSIADLRPLVAKRHYHETGALRWYEATIAPLSEVREYPDNYRPRAGGAGTFILAVPTLQESAETARLMALELAGRAKDWDLVIGLPQQACDFSSLARELLATEQVREESPALQGDRVARREVEAKIVSLRGYIESELAAAFDSAVWYAPNQGQGMRLSSAALNGLASTLADGRFSKAPRIQNELLNRVKPSSNAVAAQNFLLRRMAQHEGEARLGIEGFPAEGGLFEALLEKSRVYRLTAEGWRFVAPGEGCGDPCLLGPAWQAATELLESNRNRAVPVTEIYELWRQAPYGIKEGLLPVLATAFILSQRRSVAVYRQNVFQARLTDLDMDYLARDASDIQLRWMDLSERSRELLSDMASIVRDLDQANVLADLEPIDVAKGLVAIHDRLEPWVGRTQHLSANARRVRQLFKQASDPNSLIFDDIPQSLSDDLDLADEKALKTIAGNVREGLEELQGAYPAMLRRLRETLLAELQVPNTSGPMLAELRARAENVRELSGDHRMEAFVMRLAQFQGTEADLESLASMVASKPPRNWVDADIDRATVELADMAQRFIRSESFAHVKGRADRRHAMAVTVGVGGRPGTVREEFDVNALERPEVDALVASMQETLQGAGEERRNVILAALAELSAGYLGQADDSEE